MKRRRYKPCPHCGCKRTRLVICIDGWYMRQCRNMACGMRTEFEQTEEIADYVWNRRPQRKAKVKK